MIYLQLCWSFFLVGCFSFGGGYAALPLIDRQVTSYDWMTTNELTDLIVVSGMLPGSIGINAATFIGYEMAGPMGAVIAIASMVFPSFSLIIFISSFLKRFKENKTVADSLYGIKPAIVGLIIYSAIRFALSMNIMTTSTWNSLGILFIFSFSFLSLIYRKFHPVWVILLAGIGGIILL